MKFEDIQSIWDSQNGEKLFAINETALHAYITRKGRTISNLLGFFEWMMIAINLIAGISLLIDLPRDTELGFDLILPFVYLAFSAYALLRRLRRRADEVRFQPTILGELDRAIWQIDYLIRQGRSITTWYVMPLVLAIAITVFSNQKPLWVLLSIVALIPISYFGVRWEINKWHLPKKRDLESLRTTLLAQETNLTEEGDVL